MEQLLVLSWRSHPARERPLPFAVAIAALCCTTLAALWYTGSMLVALAMLFAVWLSTYEFFVPTDYRVDSEGVTMRRPAGVVRHRSWPTIRRVVRERNGLLVSPFRRRRTFLDERRGLYLRFTHNANEVNSLVNAFLVARNPQALD